MANNKKWSNDEEEVVISCVKESPENLKEAFTKASTMINRTPSAITTRWYDTISNNADKHSTCFMCISKRKYARNRKNVKKDIPAHTNNSIWGRLISFFFE